MQASGLLVKCLENEGVKVIFGLPGEENEDLLFSLENSTIKFVATRHEQGAAFMADVYGRLTGRAGVCLSTLGPGATNLLTGVADAFLDKSPLVAITGQAGLKHLHHESHQYLDIVNMFRPVTKWNSSIVDPNTIPELVRKAFKVAEAEKPGSTHIELSEDVAKMAAVGSPIPKEHVRRPFPSQTAIQEAVSLLKRSNKPLIIAGNGAIRKMASNELRSLSAKFHIPVIHTFMGQGAISDKSNESLHSIGVGFRDIVMDAVDTADIIITVGYDIAEYDPARWNKGKTILHIDFCPAEVDVDYNPAVEVVADISSSLTALGAEMEAQKCKISPYWYAPIREKIISDLHSYDLSNGDAFTIPGVINILRSTMKDDDLLISDVGIHKVWIGRNFPCFVPNGCLISNGLASMGIALPGGISASLVNPGRRIVVATGDGGFMMNSQEIETAKRAGAKFTVLLFKDNDYGLISWKQRRSRGHSFGTEFTNPDFKKYAEGFGVAFFSPRNVAELKTNLRVAVNSEELCIVEIPVDSKANSELFKKYGA